MPRRKPSASRSGITEAPTPARSKRRGTQRWPQAAAKASGTAGWLRMDGMGSLGERRQRQHRYSRVSSGAAKGAGSIAPADRAQAGNLSWNKRQSQGEAYRMRRAPVLLPPERLGQMPGTGQEEPEDGGAGEQGQQRE